MRENITKVAERGERLDSLQDKTGALLFWGYPFLKDGGTNSYVATPQITLLCPHKVSAVEPIGFARCVIPSHDFVFSLTLFFP